MRLRSQARRGGGVVGLDLSLRSAAACWIPPGWKGDTSKLTTGKWGEDLRADATPEDRVRRFIMIANGIVALCDRIRPEAVYVEDYAFAQGTQARARELAELGGVVKADLFRECDLVVVPVTVNTARKTLLQKLPRKDAKRFTEDNVRRLGGEAPYWNGDEVDAFVIANHGVMLMGGVPLSFPGK